MKTLALLAAAGTVSTAAAQSFISPNLPGTRDFDAWDTVSLSRFNPQVAAAGPAFPSDPFNTFQPWLATIDSSIQELDDMGTPDVTDDIGVVLDPTGDAGFAKLSGAGFPATASVYAGFLPGSNGSFSVFDTTPIADIETVVLQINIGEGDGGSLDASSLNLLLNGGTNAPAPVFSQVIDSGLGFDPSVGDITIDVWLVQWDLRGLGPITSIDAQFSTEASSTTIRGLQLDQGSEFVLVPAPASAALLSIAGLVTARRRR